MIELSKCLDCPIKRIPSNEIFSLGGIDFYIRQKGTYSIDIYEVSTKKLILACCKPKSYVLNWLLERIEIVREEIKKYNRANNKSYQGSLF